MGDKDAKRREEALTGATDRLEGLMPLIAELICDVVEGRKFIAIESTPKPGGDRGFITTFHVCDNADAPARTAAEPI